MAPLGSEVVPEVMMSLDIVVPDRAGFGDLRVETRLTVIDRQFTDRDPAGFRPAEGPDAAPALAVFRSSRTIFGAPWPTIQAISRVERRTFTGTRMKPVSAVA